LIRLKEHQRCLFQQSSLINRQKPQQDATYTIDLSIRDRKRSQKIRQVWSADRSSREEVAEASADMVCSLIDAIDSIAVVVD
jgi:hypothetical protein